jgi:hypothetical protein
VELVTISLLIRFIFRFISMLKHILQDRGYQPRACPLFWHSVSDL